MNLTGLGINDLTGIEAFTALTGLNCSLNNLTGINLNSNTALLTLNCSGNALNSIDVSNNTLLQTLQCHNIQISSIDVTNNTALTILDVSLNSISTIDLSNNTSLITLFCGQNPLTTLNVSNNIALQDLYCEIAQLTSLDVLSNVALLNLNCSENSILTLDLAANTALQTLDCAVNQLSALNVSNNTNLTSLSAALNNITNLDVTSNLLLQTFTVNNNLITSIDVSANTALTTITCSNNALTSLNIQNGNNSNLVFFEALNNPSLTCIQVDVVADMNTSWSAAKDATATYSTVCPLVCNVSIPDANFKAALVANDFIDTNFDDEIQCAEASAFVGQINVSGLGIADLTGIEAFTSLLDLRCQNNSLTSLNVSANTALTFLQCSYNDLTSLDVSSNTLLNYLQCDSNLLTSLDVTNNPSLIDLRCNLNQLTTLDLSNNVSILTLLCAQNNLSSINVSNCINLGVFDCADNQLTNLNVTNNTQLTYLKADLNQLTNIDLSANVILEQLNLHDNQLTSIDVSAIPTLQLFYCADNQLTSIDVSNRTALYDLNCSNNLISTLNITNTPSLLYLNCFTNQLTAIDISSNSNLIFIDCHDNNLSALNVQNGNNNNFTSFNATVNPSLTCIQVDDASYSNTAPNWFKDAAATYSVSCGLIADFTANITTICQNGTVIFSNQSSGTTVGTTYAWDFGAGANPPSAIGAGPHTVTYSTAGTADVSLTVTDGITDTKTSLAYININAKPTIPAINLADNCGNSVLTVSGLTNPFTWTDGDLTNPRTVLSSGTFGVFQTALGCNSDTAFVSANPLTIPAPPTLNVVDNCGASVITALGVIGILNWSDFGAGNPRVETSGTFTATQDVAGCVSATSNSVTVNPLAVPNTSLITGNMIPNCAATGQTYAVVLNAGSNYAWSVPIDAVVTSGAIGPDNHSITVDFGTTNGIISVVETNSVGCTGLSVDTIISLQGCALAANFTADVTTICEGASVTFTDLSTGTTGSTTYAWDFGNGQVANTSGPHVIQYNSNGSFTVGLTITEGCFKYTNFYKLYYS
jgi:Leucine-rich repeat (LRR) protein